MSESNITNPNAELLTWAVENITEWNDDYTHLRSDSNGFNSLFYTNGTNWKIHYKLLSEKEWECVDEQYTFNETFSRQFSTKTPQVITREEWLNAKHKTRVVFKTPSKTSCSLQEGHIHAELMAEYALVAKKNPKPWEEFEYLGIDGVWESMSSNISWYEDVIYRRKPSPPKTMKIGDIGVEACPLKEALNLDAPYYMLSEDQGYFCADLEHWDNNEFDMDRLKAGKLFATRQECVAVADALNSIYKKAVDGAWEQ
jgi:hypothetical protein